MDPALRVLEAHLDSPPSGAPILLVAPPGGGRRRLARRAAERLGARLETVDPGGFEDGRGALARFAAFHLALRGEDDRAEAFASFAGRLPETTASAVLLALLLAREPSEAQALAEDILADGPAASDDGTRSDDGAPRQDLGEELLGRLLGRLGRDRPVLLHVLEASLLPRTGLDALARAVAHPAADGRARLLLSLAPEDPVAERSADPERAERVVEVDGTPGDGDGDGAGDDPLVPVFGRLSADGAGRLERFLGLAALTGRDVPADLLFAHMGLDDARREELLDALDDHLVAEEADPEGDLTSSPTALFLDCGYGHPSLPRTAVYRLVDDSARATLLARRDAAEHRRDAADLLRGLGRRLGVGTRGAAAILRSVARRAGSEPESPGGAGEAGDLADDLSRELAWWSPEAELPALVEHLRRELAAGRLAPATVLRVLGRVDRRWPPARRLALTRALADAPDGDIDHDFDLGPGQRFAVGFHATKALADLGRLEEALDKGRPVLEEARGELGGDHPDVALLASTLGTVLAIGGRFEEAVELLEPALETVRENRGPKHPDVAAVSSALGDALRGDGQPERAQDLHRRALAIHRELHGDVHPSVADDWTSLARVARDLGEMDDARQAHANALAIRHRLYGERHPTVAAEWNNLAAVLQELGEHDGARGAFENAVAVLRELYGERHPNLALVLGNLATLLFDMDEPEAACEHLGEARRLAEAHFGPGHPYTVQLGERLDERCG